MRMHGQEFPVRCKVISLHGLSAHGDRSELMRWMKSAGEKGPVDSEHPPGPRVFFTHGEPESAFAFAERVHSELGWETSVPELDEVADLAELVERGGRSRA